MSPGPFPFHRLPVELLLSVFELLRTSADDSESQTGSRGLPFPMILSHVNRTWRNNVIEAASLWTDIRIDTAHVGSENIANLYMERSKKSSIDLTMCVDRWDSMDVVLSCTDRWRRLRITLADESVASSMLEQLRSIAAPQLEVLELSIQESLPPVPSHFGWPILTGGAPRLRTWRTLGFPKRLLPSSLDQLNNLTFISSSEFAISWTELQSVSTNLTSLSLEAVIEAVSVVIEFPTLKTLNVRWPTSFPAFTAPNLEHLTVQQMDTESMEALIHRLKCPRLSTLIFQSHWNAEPSPDPSFFRQLPLLKSIALIRCSEQFNRAVLDPLAEYGAKGALTNNLLPNLQTISIDASAWLSVQLFLTRRIADGCTTVNRVILPDMSTTHAILPHLKIWLGHRDIRLDIVDEFDHPMLIDTEERDWLREVENNYYDDEDDEEDDDDDEDDDDGDEDEDNLSQNSDSDH